MVFMGDFNDNDGYITLEDTIKLLQKYNIYLNIKTIVQGGIYNEYI